MSSFDSDSFDTDSFDIDSFDLGVGSGASAQSPIRLLWRVTMQPDYQAFTVRFSDYFCGFTKTISKVAAKVTFPSTRH